MKPITFKDVQTQRAAVIEPSDYVNVYNIGVAGVVSVSVPDGAYVVAFSSTGNFFVNFNGVMASGSSNTTGTGDELNPTTRNIQGRNNFTIYAPAALTISVAFYGEQ